MCYEAACHRSFLILQHPKTGISPRSIHSTHTACRAEGHRCDSATERSKSGFGSCSVTCCALRLDLLVESLGTPVLQIRMRATSSQQHSPPPQVHHPSPPRLPRGLGCSPPVPHHHSKALLAGQLRATSHLPSAKGTASHRLHPQKAAPEARPRPLTEEGITHIPKGSGLVYIKIKTFPHAGLDSHQEGGSWTAHLSTLLSGRRDTRGLRHTALLWLVELFGNFPGVND